MSGGAEKATAIPKYGVLQRMCSEYPMYIDLYIFIYWFVIYNDWLLIFYLPELTLARRNAAGDDLIGRYAFIEMFQGILMLMI